MKTMKKVLSLSLVIGATILITFSCKKESKTDELNAQLSNTEATVLKSYAAAKAYDDTLKTCVDQQGNVTCPRGMMNDSLYHMNDSLFNLHYLKYCKEMMDGDNMMGGNMMGGNAMHGSTMMGTHTYMGDTSLMNQNYRMMGQIRTNHATHHPKK